jgi:uncharacterized oligopeptide transporter (OPT) family protein
VPVYKFLTDGFRLFPSEIETTIPGYKGAAIGADILPALLGVGYIIGPKISAYMLSGAALGWFAIIPLILIYRQRRRGYALSFGCAHQPIGSLGCLG